MATTVDWPSSIAFRPAQISIGVEVAEATFTGFYTGNKTRRSSLADRLVMTVTLAPCLPAQAGQREAFIVALKSAGYWVKAGIPGRTAPVGTARGTMQANGTATAGARTLAIKGTTAGGTLVGGDLLAVGTNTLIQVAYAGATADGSGNATVPLSMPLPVSLANNASVTWSEPKGLWELDDDGVQLDYSAPVVQNGVTLRLRQVISA